MSSWIFLAWLTTFDLSTAELGLSMKRTSSSDLNSHSESHKEGREISIKYETIMAFHSVGTDRPACSSDEADCIFSALC